jgi:hypothetical protein
MDFQVEYHTHGAQTVENFSQTFEEQSSLTRFGYYAENICHT